MKTKKIENKKQNTRYDDMEFAWISARVNFYPNLINIEYEKEQFKLWFNSELGQKYILNT
jgi:hypothetical protein